MENYFKGELSDAILFSPDTWLQRYISKIIGLNPLSGAWIWLIHQQHIQKEIARINKEWPVDVVHVASPISILTPLTRLVSGPKFIVGPLVQDPGNALVFSNATAKQRLRQSLRRMIGLASNGIFSGRRAANIILCEGEAGRFLLWDEISVKALHVRTFVNGVEPHWFDIQRQPSTEPSFVYAGRLVDTKGVIFLLEAFAKLGTVSSLTIVGEGPEKKHLKAFAALRPDLRIKFLEWASHSELAELYSQSWAFVTPSFAEAGGTALQEAMAAGTFVIATKWGGHLARIMHQD